MTTQALAAAFFVLVCAGNVAFQIALILGVPWGEITQGGQNPGALGIKGRLLAALSIPVIVFQAVAIADAGGLLALNLAHGWGWLAVGIAALTAGLNLITPSRKERLLWAPIALSACGAAILVMVG